jgi:hypothetical protein
MLRLRFSESDPRADIRWAYFPPASRLAAARANSMNNCAAGLRTRLFKVAIAIGSLRLPRAPAASVPQMKWCLHWQIFLFAEFPRSMRPTSAAIEARCAVPASANASVTNGRVTTTTLN